MYGNGAGAADTRTEQPQPPIEPVSSIHQNINCTLYDANNALDVLLAKVRGSQPSKVAGGIEKAIDRHVMADARSIRDLANQIMDKVNELHRFIGHDK